MLMSFLRGTSATWCLGSTYHLVIRTSLKGQVTHKPKCHIRWGVILCHLAGQEHGAFGRRRRSQQSRREKEKRNKNNIQQAREISLKQFGPHIFHASSSQPSWKCFGRFCVCSSILMLAAVFKVISDYVWYRVGTSKATGHFQLNVIFCKNSSRRRGVNSQG